MLVPDGRQDVYERVRLTTVRAAALPPQSVLGGGIGQGFGPCNGPEMKMAKPPSE
jgi:hypothetical protein